MGCGRAGNARRGVEQKARPQTAPHTVRPFLLTMKRKGRRREEEKEVGKEAVLKRVGNAYVQKGNGFERENSNSERRGRERKARVRSLPKQGEPKLTVVSTRQAGRETALRTIRFGLNLRPRTGADRRVEAARRTSGIARIGLAMRR